MKSVVKLDLFVKGNGNPEENRPKTGRSRVPEATSPSRALSRSALTKAQRELETSEQNVEHKKQETLIQRSAESFNPKIKDQQGDMLPEKALFLRFRHVYAGKGGWYGCHCKSAKHKCNRSSCSSNGISGCLCVSPLSSNNSSNNFEGTEISTPFQIARGTPNVSSSKRRLLWKQKTTGNVAKDNSNGGRFNQEPLSCVGRGCGDMQKVHSPPPRKCNAAVGCLNAEEERIQHVFPTVTHSADGQHIKIASSSVETTNRHAKSAGIKPLSDRINMASQTCSSAKARLDQPLGIHPPLHCSLNLLAHEHAPTLKGQERDELVESNENQGSDLNAVATPGAMEPEVCGVYIMPLNERGGQELEGKKLCSELEQETTALAYEVEEDSYVTPLLESDGDLGETHRTVVDVSGKGKSSRSKSDNKDKFGFFGNMSTAAKQVIGEYYAENAGAITPTEQGINPKLLIDVALNKTETEATFIAADRCEKESLHFNQARETSEINKIQDAVVYDGSKCPAVASNNKLRLAERKMDDKNSEKISNGTLHEKEKPTQVVAKSDKTLSNVFKKPLVDDNDGNYDYDDDEIEDITIQSKIKCIEWLTKYT